MMKDLSVLDEVSDGMIWRQLLKGDVEAFECLMTTHYGTLFWYGRKFSDDEEFIRDKIQDLFLYIWEKRRNLKADVPVKPYLMASLRRMMHRAHDPKLVHHPSLADHPALFDVKFSVEREYITRESTLLLAKRIRTVLDKLPPRQKEVIYLKFFQDLSRDQIATVMNIAPQTVSNVLQIAVKQLRIHWKG